MGRSAAARYAEAPMGKVLQIALAGLVVAVGCSNDYDEFSFTDAGASAGGGAAGAGNGSATGGSATGGASTGGAAGAGGAATGGAGNATGTGGSGATGGVSACGQCPAGMICESLRCQCTAASQCGSGPGVECNSQGRCVCDGDWCRPGEVCDTNGSNVRCACNGGQGCDNDELCCSSGCASPWDDEQNCGACGQVCGTGQQCMGGHCVG